MSPGPAPGRDPYAILGISPSASDAEVRSAFRALARRHHPDLNGGSPEAARRFEAVQEAYSAVLAERRQPRQPRHGGDPSIEHRIAELERELREAAVARERVARERARRAAAREAGAAGRPQRPSDEELGYVRTDDSFGKILEELIDGLERRIRDRH